MPPAMEQHGTRRTTLPKHAPPAVAVRQSGNRGRNLIDRCLARVSPGQRAAYCELVRDHVKMGFWGTVLAAHVLVIFVVAKLLGLEGVQPFVTAVESIGFPTALIAATVVVVGNAGLILALGANQETRKDRGISGRFSIRGRVSDLSASPFIAQLANRLRLEPTRGTDRRAALLESRVSRRIDRSTPAGLSALLSGGGSILAAALLAGYGLSAELSIARLVGAAILLLAGLSSLRFGLRLRGLARYDSLLVTATLKPSHPSRLTLVTPNGSGLDASLDACQDWILRIECSTQLSETLNGGNRVTISRADSAEAKATLAQIERMIRQSPPTLLRSA